MYEGKKCLGLTPESTNEEIKAAAFGFVQRVGAMAFATTAVDGKTPTVRFLEVHALDDAGNLYVGASRGKHFCDEMQRFPEVSAVALDIISVRISARLAEVPQSETALYDRYWQLNPGTKAMYHKDLSNFRLFRFEEGEGEVFHVYRDDGIARARFAFGGQTCRPWSYTVNNRCIGCGACAEKCMMDTIKMEGGVAVIHHDGCNECGICHAACSSGAIDKNEWTTR